MKLSPTELLTSLDLCAELNVSFQTMCAWSKAGKAPAIRMPDGSWRYRWSEIDAWLAARSNT